MAENMVFEAEVLSILSTVNTFKIEQVRTTRTRRMTWEMEKGIRRTGEWLQLCNWIEPIQIRLGGLTWQGRKPQAQMRRRRRRLLQIARLTKITSRYEQICSLRTSWQYVTSLTETKLVGRLLLQASRNTWILETFLQGLFILGFLQYTEKKVVLRILWHTFFTYTYLDDQSE